MPFFTVSLEILFIPLLGLFALTAVNTAFKRLHRKESRKNLDTAGKLFFYRYIIRLFFPHQEPEDLYFSGLFTQNVLRFSYAVLSLLATSAFTFGTDSQGAISLPWHFIIFYLFLFFLFMFIFGEYLGRVIGTHFPEKSILILGPVASIFMSLCFPLIFILLKFFHRFPIIYVDHSQFHSKPELMEMIEEYTSDQDLDPQDKELIESVMEFKGRVAREIMVPRVDMFSLPIETSIKKAAAALIEEGYSRIPIYQNSLDNIIGVLMYKDLLTKYMEYAKKADPALLEQSIQPLVKSALYMPETKKIAELLQEFRKQQVHLAIIVDEYGATEGIVTIEDILEEIVGDISDEYDETKSLIVSLPDGGWLIDAKMGILDLEEQLGIEIEQKGDYDTVGGYVFHETGMIPPKGFILKKDGFEIEVLRSSNRHVEKLKIQKLLPTEEEKDR